MRRQTEVRYCEVSCACTVRSLFVQCIYSFIVLFIISMCVLVLCVMTLILRNYCQQTCLLLAVCVCVSVMCYDTNLT